MSLHEYLCPYPSVNEIKNILESTTVIHFAGDNVSNVSLCCLRAFQV